MLVAEVALPLPVQKTFFYSIPEAMSGAVRPGARVRVPFGARRVAGVCVALRERGEVLEERETPVAAEARKGARQVEIAFSGPEPPEEEPAQATGELRPIERLLDREPALDAALLELCRFIAEYYRCSWGEALAAGLPGSLKRRQRKREPRAAHPEGETSVEGRTRGAEEERVLTPDQTAALEAVLEPVRARRFGVTLVHGVTGSGKTEVYLRAMEETLRLGRGSILLVPEIALTPQTVARVRARFGRVALLHSRESDAERARQWELVRRGEARIVVGPRSAVFAPVRDLGLIVVDEEHDASFKQDSTPRYNARDVAVARARLEGASAILGSATPSLESYWNAKEGRYRGIYLAERATRALLPSVAVVDLGAEMREVDGFPFISRRLDEALRKALSAGEQAILFLNRRGFATFLRCRRCKEVLTCRDCAVALTFHKKEGEVLCHHCEMRAPPPAECPRCLANDIHYFGFGTERIEEELARRYPGTSVARVDSDSVADADELAAVLERFSRGEAQVLVGTQMVAKGLDFPRVTVVGVISADTALNFPDFRAAERTFQLVAQVAGRAGRAALAGVSIVQTFCPNHPSIRFAETHDSLGFLEQELVYRRKLGYPPFSKLAKVVLSDEDEARAARAAGDLAAELRAALPGGGASVLGPAPAPIAVLRKRYRYLILIKAGTRAALKAALDATLASPHARGRARVSVDVDPMSML